MYLSRYTIYAMTPATVTLSAETIYAGTAGAPGPHYRFSRHTIPREDLGRLHLAVDPGTLPPAAVELHVDSVAGAEALFPAGTVRTGEPSTLAADLARAMARAGECRAARGLT